MQQQVSVGSYVIETVRGGAIGHGAKSAIGGEATTLMACDRSFTSMLSASDRAADLNYSEYPPFNAVVVAPKISALHRGK